VLALLNQLVNLQDCNLPYFLQNIELEDYFYDDKKYLKCTITMSPLEVIILSKEFVIYRK